MLDWLAEKWNALVALVGSIFLTLWDLLSDFVCFLFDTVFTVVVGIFNGLGGAFSSFGITQYINMLPSEMLNIMALVGVNEVTAIIVTALIIRFTLQLIPFVRLGS